MKKLKKLDLKKITVSNLNKKEMNNFLGGKVGTAGNCISEECDITNVPCFKPPDTIFC